MERLIITIDTTNAGTRLPYQVARILRELAEVVETGDVPTKLRDINGNTVGTVVVE